MSLKSKNNTGKNDSWKVSGISRKFPSYRNANFVTTASWLKYKQHDDEAEGLWRIHDGIYDFTDFIDHHPGGSFWLAKTKGMDITESFESHHISIAPERMLAKFKVRDAKQPRNYTFTWHEKGFYRTLKKRVREQLQKVDNHPHAQTNLIHSGLCLATFAFIVASALTRHAVIEVLAALFLCWLSISAHNYFHRRDNWRMYTFNLTLLNYCDWRISHALSHHAYPNSLHDLEMALFEPFACWVPNPYIATKFHRVISLVIQPIFYALIFPFSFVVRVIKSITNKNVMYWHDLMGFTVPLLMIIVSHESVVVVFRQWVFILAMSSFIFGLIGLNAAHHGPKIHHDGDANRDDRDWGLFQIDTIIDRGDIKGSQFMVLTHFGEHILHHLFPTMDHGLLPQLTPVLKQTIEEFRIELRECGPVDHLIGQNLQLLRTVPNSIPPGGVASSNKKKL